MATDIFLILPLWQNFIKSSHTDFNYQFGSVAAWPDLGIKSSQNFSKSSHSSFYFKLMIFKIAKIITKYLGYFAICGKDLSINCPIWSVTIWGP